MTNLIFKIYIVWVPWLLSANLFCQSLGVQGEISSWLTLNPDPNWQGQLGIRYIPDLSLKKQVTAAFTIDGELAFKSYFAHSIQSGEKIESNNRITFYRTWIRFSSNQFEIRVGLQKINFGSATLLRPLMWFDRIDPRDPLQLTDGVFGILGRYYFLNNANVWFWGLYANDGTKGWELIPSDKTAPEYGGRIQIPFISGEFALTYHHRKAHPLKEQLLIYSTKTKIAENRFGLDGKWDVGIGLWMEAVLIHQDFEKVQMHYQRLINGGLDYTFDIGNGLHALTEFFHLDVSDGAFEFGPPVSFSAISCNYPIGLLDILNVIVYYDWKSEDWYRFANWKRRYDNWSFYLMVFWNPDRFQIYQNQQDRNMFTGKGMQLMIVYNH